MALRKSTDPLVNEPIADEPILDTPVEETPVESTPTEEWVPQPGWVDDGRNPGFPSRDFRTPLGYPQPTYDGPNV